MQDSEREDEGQENKQEERERFLIFFFPKQDCFGFYYKSFTQEHLRRIVIQECQGLNQAKRSLQDTGCAIETRDPPLPYFQGARSVRTGGGRYTTVRGE